MRQIVLAQRDLDLHAGVRVAAEHFDHARDRLALRRRLLDDLDDDDVARLRLAASVVRHQQVLVDAAVLRDDESDAALVVEPADDGDVGARQHVDDLALRPAAPVGAGAARRGAVAVQDLVHLGRTEEEIRASVVRNEKPEPVRMPLHGAGDEVELRRDAELALAIHQQLAVATHRIDAAHERVARAARDRHRARELGGRQRNAGLLQRIENRDPRRQQRGIDVVAPARFAAAGSLDRDRDRTARDLPAGDRRVGACREPASPLSGGIRAALRACPPALILPIGFSRA